VWEDEFVDFFRLRGKKGAQAPQKQKMEGLYASSPQNRLSSETMLQKTNIEPEGNRLTGLDSALSEMFSDRASNMETAAGVMETLYPSASMPTGVSQEAPQVATPDMAMSKPSMNKLLNNEPLINEPVYRELSRESALKQMEASAGFPKLQAQAVPSSNNISFANAVKLETLESNLLMEFAFLDQKPYSEEDLKKLTGHTRVVIQADVAKKLLFNLADLFQADIVPR
jgi:hypothetical protein